MKSNLESLKNFNQEASMKVFRKKKELDCLNHKITEVLRQCDDEENDIQLLIVDIEK